MGKLPRRDLPNLQPGCGARSLVPGPDSTGAGGTAGGHGQRGWNGARLELALSQLKPEHRRQFELRHRDGLRWAAIEEQLGVSERTLKDRDVRIRAALREAMRR